MKSFKFQKVNILYQVIPLGIAIMLLGLAFFEILDEGQSELNKLLKAIAYIIIALHFAQTLWYKNYVSYNKKGITIRLSRNILQERTFQFKYLEHITSDNKIITFNYRNKPESLHLNNFNTEDINTLITILKSNTNK